MHKFTRGIANRRITRELRGFRNTTARINKTQDRAKVGAARTFFGTAERAFGALGLTDAAQNLRHYRAGTGTQRNFTDKQIAKHLPITEAVDTNLTQFGAKTFVAKIKNKPDVNKALLNLKDGETYTFEDNFKRGLEYGGAIRDKPIASLLSGFGLPAYAAFGQAEVNSQGNFTATREGNRLIITGTVRNGFDTKDNDNLFDFNPGQIGGRSAQTLEKRGEAARFRMNFDRRQDVESVSTYQPTGSLSLHSVTWGSTY